VCDADFRGRGRDVWGANVRSRPCRGDSAKSALVDRCRRLGACYRVEPAAPHEAPAGDPVPAFQTDCGCRGCGEMPRADGNSQSPGDDERASVGGGRAGVNATVVRPPALSQPPHRAADRLHTSALSPCLALPCLADSRPRSDGWLHRRRLLSATVCQLLIAVLADDIFGRSLWVMSAITVSGM